MGQTWAFTGGRVYFIFCPHTQAKDVLLVDMVGILEMAWNFKYKFLDVELDSSTAVNLICNPINPMHP